ncbi:putative small multi-drug export protein [Gracilaria domingensis]|nr:putative small multi-drug export protein [Gracilaria domingensis]
MGLLRLAFVQRVASKVLDRARRKARTVSNSASQARALALFVGVPLPGTGAWTGCVIAFVLAAVIVTSLCFLGKAGGVIAASVLLGTALISLLNSFRASAPPSGETTNENHVASQTYE